MGENRISSGVFVKLPSGRISRFLTIGNKSDFTSSGSSNLVIASALK